MLNHGLQVLYIEDDELVRRASVQSLQLAGFDVIGHASVESAAKMISADFSGVIVSDIRLPGASGLELLAQCHERAPDVPVILVTGHGDISMAVQAMRDGAYDFIEKPFASERLIETVRRALERRKLVLENLALRRELAGQNSVAPRIIGRSPAIEQVRRLIANVAPTDASVLINGDTGAGKELIARSLHELSPRRDKPFIAVNCGALPEQLLESELFGHAKGAFTGAVSNREGLFQAAEGGTLFLDEIGDMPLPLQGKLLRVLQDKEFEPLGSNRIVRADVRIIAATSADLSALVAAGRFRADLFYRLNVFPIEAPSLRQRREDIPALVDCFITRFNAEVGKRVAGCAPETLAMLQAFDWPGNVRQLENAVFRAIVLAARERHPALPDVPTIAEAGPVKGYEASSWFGLLAPAGTPKPVIDKINAAALATRLGIDASLLPDLVDPGTVIGRLRPGVAERIGADLLAIRRQHRLVDVSATVGGPTVGEGGHRRGDHGQRGQRRVDQRFTDRSQPVSPQGEFATWRSTRQSSGYDVRSFQVKAKPVRPVSGLRPGMSVLFDWSAR